MRGKQKQQGQEPQESLLSGPTGYTILEVMLFLAISSLMFVIAATAVSGKQARAEFQQGLQSTNDTIRQVMNDVSNGQFDSRTDTSSGDLVNVFKCTPGMTGMNIDTSSTVKQGQNKGCIFMGKIIRLSANTNSFVIHTLVGRQFNGSDISDGVPTNMTQANLDYVPALTTPGTKFKWDIDYTNAWDNTVSPKADIGALAVIKSFASTSASTLASGSQDVFIVPIPTAGGSTSSPANMRDYLRAHPNPPSSLDVTICFDSGSGQYGAIQIGGTSSNGQGQKTTTNVKISNSTITGC